LLIPERPYGITELSRSGLVANPRSGIPFGPQTQRVQAL